MDEFKIKLGIKETIIIIAIVLIICLLSLFGITGIRTGIGLLIIILPFYYLLKNLNIETEEKIILSFFFGIGLFPSLVYYPSLFVPILVVAIITTLLILILSYVLKKRKASHD